MYMARATFDALRDFGRRRGSKCDGDADWKVVQDFIDVGFGRSNPANYLKKITDGQLRLKIEILRVPWRSLNGR
jgi:hypothetical protein